MPQPDSPTLFELPLDGERAPLHEPESLIVPDEDEAPVIEDFETPTEVLAPEQLTAASPGPLLAAGFFDFLALLAVLTIALVGAVTMGVGLNAALLAPLLLFAAIFSFLYYVLPLAFWGRTPGMSWAQLVARDDGNQPLTFGQTALRWVGAVVTAALLGVPLLLALSGRSLADRLSGTRSYRR